MLGRQNVFVSTSESGSWDGTKDELRKLDEELGKTDVKRPILIEDTTHQDELDRLRKGVIKDEEAWISVKVKEENSLTGGEMKRFKEGAEADTISGKTEESRSGPAPGTLFLPANSSGNSSQHYFYYYYDALRQDSVLNLHSV